MLERKGRLHPLDGSKVRYSKVITVELSEIVPTLAGPRRPHDRVPLRDVKQSWLKALPELVVGKKTGEKSPSNLAASVDVKVNGSQDKVSPWLGCDCRNHFMYEHLQS